jgi:hypothetical protein
MNLTDYLSARKVTPIPLDKLPKIEDRDETSREITCLEIDEGALKPGAATAQPRPGLFTIHLAQDIYDLYTKTEQKSWPGDADLKPIVSDVLNHLRLSYEMIRKRYPNTFVSL